MFFCLVKDDERYIQLREVAFPKYVFMQKVLKHLSLEQYQWWDTELSFMTYYIKLTVLLKS